MIASARCHAHKVVNWRLEWFNTVRFRRFLYCTDERTPNDRIQKEIPLIQHKTEAELLGGKNVHGGNPFQIFDVVEISKRSSCRLRLSTFFEQLGKLGHMKIAEKYFMRLQSEGIANEDLMNLIEFYARGLTQRSSDIKRDIDGFQNIIGRLRSSSIASFDTMIKHCGRHGEVGLCIEIIQSMEKYGVQPSSSTFEPLIIFFARTLEISKAEDILQVMDNNGIEVTMKSYEQMILAYTKADNIEKAYNIIEQIPAKELTANLYNPIIHTYGLKGQLRQVLRVFKQIEQKNLKPTAENFSSSIISFASSGYIQNVERVFKLLRRQKHLTSDDYKAVEAASVRIFNRQNKKFIHRTDVKLSTATSGLPFGNAHRSCGMQICDDTVTSRTFLPSNSVSVGGDINKLFETFEKFTKFGKIKSQGELACFLCHKIIYPLIRQNRLEKALDFVEYLSSESTQDVETLCLMVVSLDETLSASRRIRISVEDKLNFLNGLHKRLKVRFSRIVYEYLLQSCLRAKKMYIAEYVIQMMKADKFQLNIFTFLILLRVAVSQGDYTKVLSIIAELKTMKHSTLGDCHVKRIIIQTLKGSRMTGGNTIDKLLQVLYPS